MVVEQAKSVTRPEGDQVPLGVQGNGCNRRRGQALHQRLWLESWRKGGGLQAGLQSVMALPGEALPVLQQVHHRHLHRVVGALVVQTQNDHLDAFKNSFLCRSIRKNDAKGLRARTPLPVQPSQLPPACCCICKG